MSGFEIVMLVVFSCVIMFFIYFIASNVLWTRRPEFANDSDCNKRSMGYIIMSVMTIIAILVTVGMYYFVSNM